MAFRRALVNVVLCLSTVAASSSVLGRLPRPRNERSEAEFEVFLEQKDDLDLLFFGSSRVYRGVVPELFDAELARRGHRIRSFNLGMRGALSHEVNELLRRALAERPARLRWVVVELGEWDRLEGNYWTHRAIAWHDWTETRSVIRSCWLEPAPLLERLAHAGINLLQFAARATALGNGAEAVRERFRAATLPPDGERSESVALAREGRGFAEFSPDEYRGGRTALNRREFKDRLTEFAKNAAELRQLNARPADLGSYNLAALRAQIDLVRAAGVEIVHVVMPGFEAVPRLHRLAEEGEVPTLLAFDDPVRYPELYLPESRFDLRHLNTRGARRLTRLLARRFSDLVARD